MTEAITKPFWNSRRRRRWRRATLTLLGLYVVLVSVVFFWQDRLAFPGWSYGRAAQPPAGAVVEESMIRAADGNTIQTWWMPTPDWTPAKGAVIYLHGNGKNISMHGRTLVQWRNEMKTGALGLDYPGFGKSTGTPNEESCYAAARAGFDWLVNEKKVAARDIVVVGQSMGCAMAIDLASRQPCRLLVTHGAFTSFPDVAQYEYFWLPERYLARLQFDNVKKIRTLQTPVFIAHGEDDHVVPYREGEQLYAAAHGPKRFLGLPGQHHAQPKTPQFFNAVRQFMAETAPEGPGRVAAQSSRIRGQWNQAAKDSPTMVAPR